MKELEEKVNEGEKGVEEGKEGLEGEDFPGKFRETPRPPDPTRTSFAKIQFLECYHPSPTLLTPICVEICGLSI